MPPPFSVSAPTSNAALCVTIPPVVNVNAPVVAILPKLVAVPAFFRLMLAALPGLIPVVSDVNMLSCVSSVNVPPPLSVSAPAVKAAVWLAVPEVVSVSAPPRVLTAPPSVMPPEPLVIDTSNALDIVEPIDPPEPIVTPLSAALAVSASDAAALPVRFIAAFTVTLPPVDVSDDTPPKFTAPPTVSVPPLATVSAPVVVTSPTLVASVLTRLMLPVSPVTDVKLLPVLASVYAPFVPFSVSVVADSAVEASWLIAPVVDSVSAPLVVTAPSVLVVRLLVRLSVPVFAVTLPMSLPLVSV